MMGYITTTVVMLVMVHYSVQDCEWKKKGITVGEGEVVDFIPPKKKVGICERGRITYKLESKVKKGYKLACNGKYKHNFAME